MPKRLHIDAIPKTPRGVHFVQPLPADEIRLDDEVTVKSHMFRECTPGNPWFEGAEIEDDESPKFVARTSMDLRRIRSTKDRVEALLSSPMIDSRPRRLLGHSKSFTEIRPSTSRGLGNSDPLILPSQRDLVSKTSRRLSRLILNRLSFSTPAVDRSALHNCLAATSPIKFALSPSSDEHLPGKENVKPASTTPKENSDAVTRGVADNSNAASTSANQDPSSVNAMHLLADFETARLRNLCNDWNGVVSEEADCIPEAAMDSIRIHIGQCQLLLHKKIPFFMTLVDAAETQLSDGGASIETFQTTSLNDLLGYWSLVATEISLIDAAFERIRQWRDDSQWHEDKRPITPARSEMVSKAATATTLKNAATPRSRSRLPKRIATSSKVSTTVFGIAKQGSKATPGRKNQPRQLAGVAAKQLDDAVRSGTPKDHGFRVVANAAIKSANRATARKHIAFNTESPSEQSFASGNAHQSYPLTPANKSGSIVAVERVQRRRRKLLETLTPLGLRPVTPVRIRPAQRSTPARGVVPAAD